MLVAVVSQALDTPIPWHHCALTDTFSNTPVSWYPRLRLPIPLGCPLGPLGTLPRWPLLASPCAPWPGCTPSTCPAFFSACLLTPHRFLGNVYKYRGTSPAAAIALSIACSLHSVPAPCTHPGSDGTPELPRVGWDALGAGLVPSSHLVNGSPGKTRSQKTPGCPCHWDLMGQGSVTLTLPQP